jgi:hypothetical protein
MISRGYRLFCCFEAQPCLKVRSSTLRSGPRSKVPRVQAKRIEKLVQFFCAKKWRSKNEDDFKKIDPTGKTSLIFDAIPDYL